MLYSQNIFDNALKCIMALNILGREQTGFGRGGEGSRFSAGGVYKRGRVVVFCVTLIFLT